MCIYVARDHRRGRINDTFSRHKQVVGPKTDNQTVSLRWSDVGDDVIFLRAENSKTRKPETMPLEGELKTIIERRRSAAVIQNEDKPPRFAEYVFHLYGAPVGDFRKAWAAGCVATGLGKMVCQKCGSKGAKRNCDTCDLPQVVAMKIAGHRTDSMFRRYAIVDENQKRDALAKTQQYLAAKPTERKVALMGR